MNNKQPKREIFEDNLDDIRAMIDSGDYTIKQISEKYDMTYYTFKHYRKMFGLPKPRNVLYKPINRDELEYAYVFEKRNMMQLAEHFGVSSATIRLRLIDYNIPIRNRLVRTDRWRKRVFGASNPPFEERKHNE